MRAFAIDRKYRWSRWFVPIFILGATAALILLSPDRPARNMVLAICNGAILVTLLAVRPLMLRSRIQSNLKQSRLDEEPFQIEISEEGLGLKNSLIESRIRWSAFLYWRESDGLILAYRAKNAFQVIPIEQFRPESATAIRNLLNPDLRR